MAQSDDSNDGFFPSEADRIRARLRTLRESIIEAWQCRAVLLTPDEQNELRDDIQETCALLTDLTGGEKRNEIAG